jgi:formamidopyrimidine-DNA glycosylase
VRAVPELPEVESIRCTLERSIADQVIAVAMVGRTDIIGAPGRLRAGRTRGMNRASSGEISVALLDGARIAGISRRGKQLAITADDGRTLVVHLGMSGRLVVGPREVTDHPRHTHAVWHVGTAHTMRFTDPRRFGALVPCAHQLDLDAHWHDLGPDALAIADDALANALASRRTSVKAALLDQSLVAGLGNIYVDEILHRAGIHPLMRSSRAAAHARTIATCMRMVLAAAINAGGSTLRDYVDATGNPGAYVTLHRVYGRAGLPCDRCQSTIRSAAVGGRTTAFCPACQGRSRPVVHPL